MGRAVPWILDIGYGIAVIAVIVSIVSIVSIPGIPGIARVCAGQSMGMVAVTYATSTWT